MADLEFHQQGTAPSRAHMCYTVHVQALHAAADPPPRSRKTGKSQDTPHPCSVPLGASPLETEPGAWHRSPRPRGVARRAISTRQFGA